jgi:RNA polymerase primary sigma factor
MPSSVAAGGAPHVSVEMFQLDDLVADGSSEEVSLETEAAPVPGREAGEELPPRRISARVTPRSARLTDHVALLMRDLGRYPTPTHEEQDVLARRAAAGDEEAKRVMALSNMRLVVSIASRFKGRGLDLPDLVQAGSFGLMRAIDLYDVDRGYRFSTYASWWIRQSIQRAIHNEGQAIRVPEHVGERAFSQEHGDLSGTGVVEQIPRVVRSLDEHIGDEGGATFGDMVADTSGDMVANPEASAVQGMAVGQAGRLLATLDETERRILCARFGFGDSSPLSLKEVAQRMSTSAARVRQAELRALLKLRRAAGAPQGGSAPQR